MWEKRYNALNPTRSTGNTRYYDGNQLRPGHEIDGPALIEERNTTILIGHRDRLAVDAGGNFVIAVAAKGAMP